MPGVRLCWLAQLLPSRAPGLLCRIWRQHRPPGRVHALSPPVQGLGGLQRHPPDNISPPLVVLFEFGVQVACRQPRRVAGVAGVAADCALLAGVAAMHIEPVTEHWGKDRKCATMGAAFAPAVSRLESPSVLAV